MIYDLLCFPQCFNVFQLIILLLRSATLLFSFSLSMLFPAHVDACLMRLKALKIHCTPPAQL